MRLLSGHFVAAAVVLLSGCGTGGTVSAASSVPATPSAGGQLREYQLTAAPLTWQLSEGTVVSGLAYNGQVPGPTITATVGDLVKVDVKNDLSTDTTVHWHGMEVPNSMDGVPDVTQKPIPAGGTFTYQFVANVPGTYWYHSHVDEMTQVRSGLYGAIVVEPRDNKVQVDRDETIVLSDFGSSGQMATDGTAPAGAPSGMPGSTDQSQSGVGGTPGMMGQGGMGGMGSGGMMGEPQQPSDHAKDFLINGRKFPAVPELGVHQGEHIRLRLINASASADHFIRLDGHQLTTVATDGHDLPQPAQPADVIRLAPAERVDVLLVADHPGVWALHSAIPEHTQMGMEMTVRYDGQQGSPTVDQTDPRSLKLWAPDLPAQGRQTPPSDKTVDLQISGNMMGNTNWTINGRTYPDVAPIDVKLGQSVRLRISNMSMEAHPMHLHGQAFEVVAIDGRIVQPAIKDTLEIGPMGSAELVFKATNPGTWLLHCHNFEHMMNGLVTVIRVQ